MSEETIAYLISKGFTSGEARKIAQVRTSRKQIKRMIENIWKSRKVAREYCDNSVYPKIDYEEMINDCHSIAARYDVETITESIPEKWYIGGRR